MKDLKQLFDGFDLSDEFKERSAETFRKAVQESIDQHKAELQQTFDKQLSEMKNDLYKEFLAENIFEIARLKKERKLLETEAANVAGSDGGKVHAKAKEKVTAKTTDRDGKAIIKPKDAEKKKDEAKENLAEGKVFKF
ncbi:hypothetical protein [Moritella viscosa]|uniref:Glycosyltransferase involved in cell wall biogenesis-like protein n=1 Tax=Moritella viscosa TaxID=80854 RepID=A0A1L0C9U0_9GAMM|nr:hypothetical protein [Moritella viscosa]SGZ17459.1 Glycosyltransferase involved in cell wall biogenesis-like protein [Moritella viscosa]